MSFYRFGRYELDVHRRSLRDGDKVLPLSAKLFGVLSCFVRSGGRPISKDELAAQVWPDQEPSDATIVQHVMLLRKMLGDSAKARDYILTVPGIGYSFIAEVSSDGHLAVVASSEDLATGRSDGVWREYLAAEQLCVGAEGSFTGLRQALKHYQAALALDPSFAPAWSGVSSMYAFMAYYGHVPWSSALNPALQAVHRAIELDPHSSLAYCLHSQLQLVQWNVSESMRLLEIAAALDPRSPHSYHLSAFIHQWRGDFKIAAADAKRSLAADASAIIVQALYANALGAQGDMPNALAIYSNVLDAHPTSHVAREGRCDTYAALGEFQLALADLAKLPHSAANASRLGCLYALMGDSSSAMRVLSALQRRSSGQYVPPHCIAQLYIALGYYDRAVALTRLALDEHDLKFPAMFNSPLLSCAMRDKRLRASMSDVMQHVRKRLSGTG